MRKIFLDYQSFIRSVAILAVVVVGSIVGIIPAGRTILSLAKDIRSANAGIVRLNQKIAVLSALDSDSLKQNFSELSSAIPLEKSPQSIFSTLEAMSAQAGTALGDVTLSGLGTIATESAKQSQLHTSGARVVQFSVSLEGTMQQTKEFFRLAGSVRRLLGIRSFDLSVSPAGTVVTKIEMDGYFAPLPGELASLSASIEPLSEREEAAITKIVSLPNLTRVAQLPPADLGGGVKSDLFSP